MIGAMSRAIVLGRLALRVTLPYVRHDRVGACRECGCGHTSPHRQRESDARVPDVRTYDLTTMKKDAMHCPACHRAMVSTSSQAFEDEKGVMTITRWRCRPCHETAEEIWLSAGYCGPDPTRIRYALASTPQITGPTRAGAKRRAYAYAGAI
jgi:hypothetical protein